MHGPVTRLKVEQPKRKFKERSEVEKDLVSPSTTTMLFKSPHPDLTLPGEDVTLPGLLLEPSDAKRASIPLLFPVAKGSPFSSIRPNATALSLVNVRQLAYKTAKCIIDGAMDGKSTSFQKGDVVAIYSSNQHDYLALILGIHLAGGVAALCNPSYKETELAHQLRMTKARCIITTAGAASTKASDNPFLKAKEAVRLASTEKDDEAAGGFGSLPEEPRIYLFEEDEELSWGARCDKVNLTDEVIAVVDERSSRVKGSDAAVFCFSSGTSGLPKAVIITHSNLVSNTIQSSFLLYDRMNEPLIDGRKYSKDGRQGWYDNARKSKAEGGTKDTGKSRSLFNSFKDKISLSKKEDKTGMARIHKRPEGQQEFHIDVLPQFHCYGLLVNLVALHTCTPRIIMPRFHLETFLQAVSEHGVTFSFVVPPILLALAKHPLVDNYDISTLWRVASGAASLPDEIASAVGKRLGIRCTDGYGMTEMSPIVAMQNVDDLAIAPNTVGVLAPNTQALVLDSKGKELSPNEAGELLLRGPQMMKGYFENEDANEKAFYYCTRTGDDQSKWLRTGDVVKIDERHYITITDRLKDVIKAKGFQVSPAELEAVLFKDSRVADVAVIGVRDEKDGAEKPWAFLVPHDTSLLQGEKDEERNQAAKAIQDKANGQMAGYKKIEGITWIEALPKSDAGKVLKKDLAGRR